MLLADEDAVHVRLAACLLGLGDERGLALLTVAPGKPVGSEPPHRRPRTDEHATPVLSQNKPFGLQFLNGVAYSHPRHPVVFDQHRLGWDLLVLP